MAYNLAVQLRDEIIALTSDGVVGRDCRFRDQIRDAAASAVSNLAEGFARFNHGEFAFFANVAKASLAEARAELEDGLRRGYFVQTDFDRLDALAIQAARVASGLIRQLKSTKTPKVNPRPARRP